METFIITREEPLNQRKKRLRRGQVTTDEDMKKNAEAAACNTSTTVTSGSVTNNSAANNNARPSIGTVSVGGGSTEGGASVGNADEEATPEWSPEIPFDNVIYKKKHN